jgi:hypothetical protein
MINIEDIADQVRKNCDIADAKSWGTYSICGLLLRLRDQYRWKKGLEPWIEINHSEILAWVSEKEKAWDSLREESFQNIKIEDNNFPPFNLDPINNILKPEGFLYGAGFLGGLRSSFFLGTIKKTWREDGFHIYLLDKEIARDIGAMPALSQGKVIILRKEPLRYFLWDKLKETQARKSTTHGEETALSLSFKAYGLNRDRIALKPEEIEVEMERIIDEELQSYLHHELGEAYASVFLGEEWKELITLFPQTRIEHMIRGVKDIMADTMEKGMLWYIIENRKTSSLGFYVSQLSGVRRVIFDEIFDAYKEFLKTGDLSLIDQARKSGYEKVKDYAERLLYIYKRKEEMGTGWVKKEIEEVFIHNRGL